MANPIGELANKVQENRKFSNKNKEIGIESGKIRKLENQSKDPDYWRNERKQ